MIILGIYDLLDMTILMVLLMPTIMVLLIFTGLVIPVVSFRFFTRKKIKKMRIIKKFKNHELLTFIEDDKIKIYIDDNYATFSIEKGYKMNLIDSNKGSYKGSFMNNYICKKFISNQKLNVINIETNKILNYCKYFLLSKKEYYNLKLSNNRNYKDSWFLRSSYKNSTYTFDYVYASSITYHYYASDSLGFIPFFMKRKGKK